jgi:nucleotide-binding universal stress UspA family protein
MEMIRACIDGKSNSSAVVDAAIWAAQQLQAPLSFLHVLERHPERPLPADFSGAIGLGAQDTLLAELSELDQRRAELDRELGQRLLASAVERAQAAGLAAAERLPRHGELAETAVELQTDTRLYVLGEHHHGQPGRKLHLDHRVERVVRSVQRPVLVITGEQFQAPQRIVVGFDGSATAQRAVERLAGSPLLAGLPVLLFSAGAAPAGTEAALQTLRDAGFAASAEQRQGEPEQVLPEVLAGCPDAWLVMGAYGHSRIRQFIVGSTTTTLLRLSPVPVLVLR